MTSFCKKSRRRQRVTIGMLAMTLVGCGTAGAPQPLARPAAMKIVAKVAPPNGHLSDRQLVIRRAGGAIAPRAGAQVVDAFAGYELHELPPGASIDAALAAYAADPGVASIERVATVPMKEPEQAAAQPASAPAPAAAKPLAANDPLYFQQYAHDLAKVPVAWTFTRGRPDAVVAVLDTGIDARHPDLEGQVLAGPSFVEGRAVAGGTVDDDADGHGTWVAGIIAAKADNGIGVAGVAPGCKVLALRLTYPTYDEAGRFLKFAFNDYVTARNIHYAATEGKARVINVSASLTGSPLVTNMIQLARSKGVVVVTSAGNDGVGSYGTNPKLTRLKEQDGVIVVHATDAADRLAGFSNFGTLLAVSAPGERILTTAPVSTNAYSGAPGHPTGYTTVTGTSFAAPFVSGIAALVFSRLFDQLEPVFAKRGIAITMQDIPGRVVEDVLRASCDDLGAEGPDEAYGRGRVNARGAMVLASLPAWLARAEAEVEALRARR